MKATITRTGGLAGITLRREVELPDELLAKLREGQEPPPLAIPDSFTYEIKAGGETFAACGPDADRLLGSLL